MALPVVLGAASLRLLGSKRGRAAAKQGIMAVKKLAKELNLKVTRNTKDGEIYISPGASPARQAAGKQSQATIARNKRIKDTVKVLAAGGAGAYLNTEDRTKPNNTRSKRKKARTGRNEPRQATSDRRTSKMVKDARERRRRQKEKGFPIKGK
jgi:hypothetical protein